MSEFTKNGGAWLGAVRSWIQCNCVNGSTITWGGSEILRCRRNFTPALVEEIVAIAVDAAFPEVDKLNEKIKDLRETYRAETEANAANFDRAQKAERKIKELRENF